MYVAFEGTTCYSMHVYVYVVYKYALFKTAKKDSLYVCMLQLLLLTVLATMGNLPDTWNNFVRNSSAIFIVIFTIFQMTFFRITIGTINKQVS